MSTPSSCISAVTSDERSWVYAATPQKSGGSTRKIDIIAPPMAVRIDQIGRPFSTRSICTTITAKIGTM